jgi:hypothetical protein
MSSSPFHVVLRIDDLLIHHRGSTFGDRVDMGFRAQRISSPVIQRINGFIVLQAEHQIAPAQTIESAGDAGHGPPRSGCPTSDTLTNSLSLGDVVITQ